MPRTPQDTKCMSFYKKEDLFKMNPFDLKKMHKQTYDLIRALTFPPFAPPSFYIGKERMVIIKESEYLKLKKQGTA